MSFGEVWNTRLNSLGWLLGKLVRLLFFFLFILAIFKHTKTIQGYTLPQAALFFLTFNLVDLAAQIMFRGIYGMRRIVVEGELDYYLIQPVSALFRIAFQTVDFLDIAVSLPVVALTFWAIGRLPGQVLTAPNIALYLALIANGVAIALAIHIVVASLAVYSGQMENMVWLYRDLMVMGRFPADIYAPAVQMVLTFLIPVAVMTTFPPKALMGALALKWIIFAFALAAALLWVSLKLWRLALANYSSVSS